MTAIPQTQRVCVTAACMNEAKGHFCMTCWKRLPGHLRNNIVQSTKANIRRKEMVKLAKDFLDAADNAKPTEGEHATADSRD